MKKLYVGNLSYETTETELEQFFSEFGPVISAKIITDQYTNRSKGFGFVEIEDDDNALEAIDALNGQELHGRSIKIDEARPRQNRGYNRDHGGGSGYNRDHRGRNKRRY